MRLLTRTFEQAPHSFEDMEIYAISLYRPQAHRKMPILYLFTPTYEIQIEYKKTGDVEGFLKKMRALLQQRRKYIEAWVKERPEATVCLVCWEEASRCHRGLAAEAVVEAGKRLGIPVETDLK